MEPASFTSMVGNSNFHPADKENSYMQKEKKATGIICIYIFFSWWLRILLQRK